MTSEVCNHLTQAARALHRLLGVLHEVSRAGPDHALALAYHRHRSRAEANLLAALSVTRHPGLRMALDAVQGLPSTLHEAARRVSWLRDGIGVAVRPDRDLLQVLPPALEWVLQAAVDLGCQPEPPPEARPERLTDHDRRLLALWREGRSLKEIASTLQVAPETVRRALVRLRKRLGDRQVPYRRPR